MNNEILKLAKECGIAPTRSRIGDDFMDARWGELEAFYRAAFNEGVEAAAKIVEECHTESELRNLSDAELEDVYLQTVLDLKRAAKKQPESEWHNECFAAYCMVLEESKRRVIGSAK